MFKGDGRYLVNHFIGIYFFLGSGSRCRVPVRSNTFLRNQHFLCSFEAKMGQDVQPRAKIWIKINLLYLRKVLIVSLNVNPIQDGHFRGCSRMRGEGAKRPPSLKSVTHTKICHTYPTMMKIGTVISYLKKIQKIYEPRDTPSEFC